MTLGWFALIALSIVAGLNVFACALCGAGERDRGTWPK